MYVITILKHYFINVFCINNNERKHIRKTCRCFLAFDVLKMYDYVDFYVWYLLTVLILILWTDWRNSFSFCKYLKKQDLKKNPKTSICWQYSYLLSGQIGEIGDLKKEKTRSKELKSYGTLILSKTLVSNLKIRLIN